MEGVSETEGVSEMDGLLGADLALRLLKAPLSEDIPHRPPKAASVFSI
jgi:hypothetical protein